jgi:hypothetical protein
MEPRLSARESRKITTGFRLPLEIIEWINVWSSNLESTPGDMVSRICDRFIKEVDMPRVDKTKRYVPMQFRKAVLFRIEDYAAARGLTKTDVVLAALKREMGFGATKR